MYSLLINIRTIIIPVLLLGLSALSSSNAFAGDPLQGGAIYAKHCAGCHGGNGIGIIAGTPNLAGNTQLMVRPDFELMIAIQMGKGIMPAFQGRLTDAQMRDVIAHIRTFF
jgi:mono/diheme cytochrome c family protein